jgi:hypothetical protein
MTLTETRAPFCVTFTREGATRATQYPLSNVALKSIPSEQRCQQKQEPYDQCGRYNCVYHGDRWKMRYSFMRLVSAFRLPYRRCSSVSSIMASISSSYCASVTDDSVPTAMALSVNTVFHVPVTCALTK